MVTPRSISQWYAFAKSELYGMGIQNPSHEALLLCESIFGVRGRVQMSLHGGDIPSEQQARLFETALSERRRRPLQYILGSWEFCSMELAVGEGVLIPRDDTAVLADTAIAALSGSEGARILDLCAGSGAVGLAVMRRLSGASCVFAELSQDATRYLKINTEKYSGGRASIICADVLREPPEQIKPGFDAIVSNPPYIPCDDIDGLSREVRCEPRMALDGGEDGLDFYRAICEKWVTLLKPGGVLAVEIGVGQAEAVSDMFARCGLHGIESFRDLGGIVRVIKGTL